MFTALAIFAFFFGVGSTVGATVTTGTGEATTAVLGALFLLDGEDGLPAAGVSTTGGAAAESGATATTAGLSASSEQAPQQEQQQQQEQEQQLWQH